MNEIGYKKGDISITSDTSGKAYYRYSDKSFRYDKYVIEWMNGKRKELYNRKLKYHEIINLIFEMKDETLQNNLYFLMDAKEKKKNKDKVKKLMNTNFKSKGRDWLDYLLNNISFDKFKEEKIVKKFIEYYDKYNLGLYEGEIVGIKMNKNPVNKDPSYMIKQWKMMYNQSEVEQKHKEESEEFINYHNENALKKWVKN